MQYRAAPSAHEAHCLSMTISPSSSTEMILIPNSLGGRRCANRRLSWVLALGNGTVARRGVTVSRH